ncbi:MAG: hypothetical protein K0S32_1342 [Bacteroidetes bacterium]|jgi:sugar lactone lactonase YvrE|nr:hypothetical protein [Bacteroidota bacterium]
MKKSLFFSALVLLTSIVRSQNISTIAGNGLPSYSGDMALAINCEVHSPNDVEVDKLGNVYIADRNNSRIRKINTSGIITTIAGNGISGFSGDGGPAVSAVLGRPTGLALDTAGNIYFVDNDNNRIRKINTSGIITTIAGDGTVGYSGDGGNALSAKLNVGWGIGVDKAGNVYWAEAGNHVIRKVTPAGIISTFVGNGIPGAFGDGGPAGSAQINNPYWVTVDRYDNIFISDMNNNKIRKVNTSGIISTFAGNNFGTAGFGGDGGPATSAFLKQPQDIAIDTLGNVYVCDGTNDRIRQIDPNGIITTYAGNGTLGWSGDGWLATFANIGGRAGIGVDLTGNLYLAEAYTNRIRKVGKGPVGIRQEYNSDHSFSIYPNPSNGKILIQTNEQQSATLHISDIKGAIVMSKTIHDNDVIDISILNEGIYFATIITSNTVMNKKIVLNRQ